MATAFASVVEFLARVEGRYVQELTTATADDIDAPPDETRIQHALDDASAELRTWFPSIPAVRLPDADGMRVHCIKVAMYLLTLDRPGKEYEQIRNAYLDTIAFYRDAAAAAATAGAAVQPKAKGSRPEPVFTDAALKGFR